MSENNEKPFCHLCKKEINPETETFLVGEAYDAEIENKSVHHPCFFEWNGSAKYLHQWYYGVLNAINRDDVTDILHYNDEFAIFSDDGLHIEILIKKAMLQFRFHIESWVKQLQDNIVNHPFNEYPMPVRFNALKNLAAIGERSEEVEVVLSTVYSMYIMESMKSSQMSENEALSMLITLLEKAVNTDYSLGIVVLHALETVVPAEDENLKILIEHFKQVDAQLTEQLYQFLVTQEAKNAFLDQINSLLLPGTPRFVEIIENTLATVEYLYNKRDDENRIKMN